MRNSWPFPTVPSPAVTAVKYAGFALGAFLLYKLVTRGVAGTAADITQGVVGGVVNAGAGAVIGAGQAVGIPPTDADKCADAIYAGRTWDASFDCPAGTFIRYVTGNMPTPPAGETTETVWTTPRADWASGLKGYNPNRNC